MPPQFSKEKIAKLIQRNREKKILQKEIENVLQNNSSNTIQNPETSIDKQRQTERKTNESFSLALQDKKPSETNESRTAEEDREFLELVCEEPLFEERIEENEIELESLRTFEGEGNQTSISLLPWPDLASWLRKNSSPEPTQIHVPQNESSEDIQKFENWKEEQIQEVGKEPTLEEEQEFKQELKRESAKVNVILNEDQEKAASLILSGKSCCIIGAAGTGKTTAMRIILQRMRDRGMIAPFSFSSKYLQRGSPGIVVLSFTNKAVANIRRGMPKDITCVTAHKLIEFQPVFYDALNAEGELCKTMRFEPARHMFNKLPSISVQVFEEAATISTQLNQQLEEARAGKTQLLYMGDIQQLPPVFGDAILGFKMLELPVIELTQVMRQALDSRVLAFAWDILKGEPMKIKYITEKYDKEGEFKIRPWKGKWSSFHALHVASLLMNKFLDSGEYNYLEDMILIPYGRKNPKRGSENYFCTDELNKSIAHKLGKDRKAVVYEIIAGFRKYYYAVGDKVLVKKQEALITKITINAQYVGVSPLDPSEKLNREGHYETESKGEGIEEHVMSEADIDLLLASASMSEEIEERKNQGSHILHYKMLDSDEEGEVQTTGEFAETSFAYALTVHKAQGSEWKRVILLLHNSHDKMISRELLYTAVTRARESLYIICESNHFEKGVLRQRIKGNTLAEKAEWFKGKQQKNGKQINLIEEGDEE